jgi:Uma2 family endonuclease
MVVLRAEMVPRTRADAATVAIPRRRFTVAEYHRMGEAGVLTEDDRVELLGGEIIRMSPIGVAHASAVDRIGDVFRERLGARVIIRVQGPVVLDRFSQPQPDITILARRDDFYSTGHPRPKDLLLAIEVMDSSRSYDRTLKLPLYAKAELRDVWLVDLRAETVSVHRRPALRGYREERTYGRRETIVPLAFPRLRIRVNEILG